MEIAPIHFAPDERGYDMQVLPKLGTVRILSSYSKMAVVRGLHVQKVTTRTVRVISGHIRDYVFNFQTGDCYIIDMLPTTYVLTLPTPFTHGFLSIQPSIVLYEFDTPYTPQDEMVFDIMSDKLPFREDMNKFPFPQGMSLCRSKKDREGLCPPVPGILREY